MIQLTAEQVQALETQKEPLEMVNPLTQEIYVLIRKDVYDLTCSIVSEPNRRGWEDPADEDLIKKPT